MSKRLALFHLCRFTTSTTTYRLSPPVNCPGLRWAQSSWSQNGTIGYTLILLVRCHHELAASILCKIISIFANPSGRTTVSFCN
ncbi:hypothetical protein F5887DRAFT_492643 [Amanita rubescens]|nr:hypothetical protein F5887DRAFT_492643 [Amanita rubescens]